MTQSQCALNFQQVSALTSHNKPAVRCEMGGQENIYKYHSSTQTDRHTVFYFSFTFLTYSTYLALFSWFLSDPVSSYQCSGKISEAVWQSSRCYPPLAQTLWSEDNENVKMDKCLDELMVLVLRLKLLLKLGNSLEPCQSCLFNESLILFFIPLSMQLSGEKVYSLTP